MTLKQRTALLLCGVMLLLMLPMTAFADTAADSMQTVSKIYALTMTQTQGSITASPSTPAFWEYPVLQAGEDYTEGTLVVRNDSDYVASMSLSSVSLPYGDTAKLAYLDQLMLTVTEGDTVLFDNSYSHINDPEGGLSIDLQNMSPGEEHVYTVKLKCLYSYAGDPAADVSQLAWNFSAKGETTIVEGPEGLPQWAMILVVGFAAVIVALIIIMIVRAIINAKKKNA